MESFSTERFWLQSIMRGEERKPNSEKESEYEEVEEEEREEREVREEREEREVREVILCIRGERRKEEGGLGRREWEEMERKATLAKASLE